ncbi:MAG: hypothetical protein ACI87E_002185 [Mariniblastus sp.]|jgi:hypothetical protein
MSQVSTFENTASIRVSDYDRTNGWLIAMIILASIMVAILGTLMMKPALSFRDLGPDIGPDVGRKSGPLVDENDGDSDFSDPSLELESLDESIEPEALIDQIPGAVSRMASAATNLGAGRGGLGGGGRREILTPAVVPLASRWEIQYELTGLGAYTRQVRGLEIELGVVSKNKSSILRISDVGQTNLVVQSDRLEEIDSVYFHSANAQAKRWDRQLVTWAGVEGDESILVHFYPDSLVAEMKRVELSALPTGKSLQEVVKTKFRLVASGQGYEFTVAGLEFTE